MRMWITCLLILLMMLASLSVVQIFVGTLGHTSESMPLISDGFLWMVGVAIVILIGCQSVIKRTKPSSFFHSDSSLTSNSPNHSITSNNTYHRILSFTPLSALIIQSVIIFLLIVGAGLHTVKAVQIELSNQLQQPIRVLATVRPIGISDSNYYPLSDMGYRQLAVIESVEPLSLNHFSKKNPSNFLNSNYPKNNALKNNFPKIQSLEGKTVLLSARFPSLPKNTKLPIGYSTQFSDLNQFQPTQSTQVMLALSPIPSLEEGFVHRWLQSRHVSAQAKVLAYHQGFFDSPTSKKNWKTTLNQWRWNIRDHFLHGQGDTSNSNRNNWQDLSSEKQQAIAVTLSLLTGDRGLINKDTKNLYQLSGISHLLAISGTHVLFLAIILSGLMVQVVNRFSPRLYSRLPRSQLRWSTMVFGALLYALFTGFDVPSARTVYMLMAVGLARLLLLDISARQVLLIVAVLMAIYDPYVLWQAGFWLSFVAVMLLISYDLAMNEKNFHLYNPTDKHTNIEENSPSLLAQFLPFINVQLWMFIALLPLSLLLFGKVSLWGVLVNLFAIGFYGWIIVPLNLLAGIVYLLLPSIADMLWGLVSFLLQVLHEFLGWLVGINELGKGGQAWLYTDVNAGVMLIMGLMFLPMLLPRHTVSRVWSFPPMMLLAILLFNQSNRPAGYSDINKTTANTQTTVTLLNTQLTGNNRNISSLLVSYDDENWLIVANHGVNFDKKNHKKKKAKAVNIKEQQSQLNNTSISELISQWQNSLGESGISALTGIIVQTPSPELLQASLSLKKLMPVGFLWQAGNKHINNHSHAVSNCTMGKNWQSDDGKLFITAMTGWQDVHDKGVWSCAISIDSDEPIQTNNQYPVYWSGKQTGYTANMRQGSKSIGSHNGDLPLVTQVIINAGGKRDRLWSLWHLLCPVESVEKRTEDISMQRQGQRQSLLLSHSNNDFPNHLIQQSQSVNKLAIKNWILLDKPSQYNQQKLPTVLLNWSSEVKIKK